MKTAACTLYEGSYHLGAGALVNSLYQNEYRGIVYVGLRGPLPPWAQSVQDGVKNDVRYHDFSPAADCTVRFIPLDTTLHFANYKPAFMRRVMETFLGPEQGLCYFDPDVVVKGRWSFYEEWLDYGVALVEDLLYPNLPSDHPLRRGWLRAVEGMGVTEKRPLSRYYNSGFVGLSYEHRNLLTVWDALMEYTEKHSTNSRQVWQTADRSALWMATDQDHLNVAVMTTEYPLSTVGPDGMDFLAGGFLMAHAVNTPKPWDKNVVRRAVQGMPPGPADKVYWKSVAAPIRLFSDGVIRKKQRDVKIGSAIGRFIRRPTM